MQYTRIGSSGLQVSRVALGMMSYGDPDQVAWFLDEDAAAPIVQRACEAGVTFFDTADMYSTGVSEEITGRLLAKFFARREDYVLASKVYYPMGPGPNDRGLSRKHILNAVDASLRRLGTDYLDLYQIHRWDNETPIEETMRALHDVVRAGKVRYIGASLMYAWQFAKAQAAAPTRFVSMQTRYNLVYREEEREMLPCCADQGVGILAYSPLARGFLARAGGPPSRRAQDENPERDDNDFEVLAALDRVAAERGLPPARIALAWVLSRVNAYIVGATKPHHLDDALSALDVTLTAEEVEELERPYRPHRLSGYS
jgi:aryl-alcohol dehydrogenase-like predicted oxidoreductase